MKKAVLVSLFQLLCLCSVNHLYAQTEDTSITNRLFMPALQMGYIHHNSEVASGGLVIQTCVEFRALDNVLFRLNYDDFAGRITINDVNNNQYKAKVPLSELIGGFGYRFRLKQHNFFCLRTIRLSLLRTT